MTTIELSERIGKCNDTISKKTNLMAKRTESIIKVLDKLHKLGFTGNTYDEIEKERMPRKDVDAYNMICSLMDYEESIKDARKAIENEKEKINRYYELLAKEMEREKLVNNLPDNVKTFMNELEGNWNRYDIRRRDKIQAMKHELYQYDNFSTEYKEGKAKMHQMFGSNWYEDSFLTDEQIKKDNKKLVKELIIDFIKRVEDKVGEITSFSNLYLNRDNQGFAILNGRVEGTEGTARVESIYAGGYNIQRLHVRVLVK